MSRWSTIERSLRADGAQLIAGMDEVGRGPLAGPVVACVIVMPPEKRAIAGVDDSKQLTASERVRLARLIRRDALACALGAASVREIASLNIYHASTLAMRRAVARLGLTPDVLLVDGKPIRTLGIAHRAVVGGDGRCYSVACASIIAKVTRDRLMASLSVRYPAYLWQQNSGYGTPAHVSALKESGLSPHHRIAFCETRLAIGSSPEGESGETLPA
jgi:ribonuclease HII